MKALFCLMLFLCPYLGGAQTIRAGDRVPDFLMQMINYKESNARLAQFKGKLILLDFWATWCGGCIKKFDMLDSMQRQHADSMQVLLINTASTKDTREKLNAFFKRYKNRQGIGIILPAVYDDLIAGKMFPHAILPHYVWISAEGNCIAITGPDEVTPANIRAVLRGDFSKLTGLALMEQFDFTKPLFSGGNGGDGEGIIVRSGFSHYIPGLQSSSRYTRNSEGLPVHYIALNIPLLEYIKKAYNTELRDDRIRMPDSLKKLLLPAGDSALLAHSYSYEIITPAVTYQQLMDYLREDISRCFNLAASWQRSPALCYVLTVDTVILSRYRSTHAKRVNHLYNQQNRHLLNGDLGTIASYLNAVMDRYVIQEDSIHFKLDICLPDFSSTDQVALIDYLASIGIRLTGATRMIDQFFIYSSPKQLP